MGAGRGDASVPTQPFPRPYGDEVASEAQSQIPTHVKPPHSYGTKPLPKGRHEIPFLESVAPAPTGMQVCRYVPAGWRTDNSRDVPGGVSRDILYSVNVRRPSFC